MRVIRFFVYAIYYLVALAGLIGAILPADEGETGPLATFAMYAILCAVLVAALVQSGNE